MRALLAVLALTVAVPSFAAPFAVKRHELRTLATEDLFGVPNLGYEYFFGDQGDLGLWVRALAPLASLQNLFPGIAKSTGVIGDVRFHHLFARMGPGAFAYTVGAALGRVTLTDPATGAADTTLWMSPVGTVGYHLLVLDDALDVSVHLGALYVLADYPNVIASGARIPPPVPGFNPIAELGVGWRF